MSSYKCVATVIVIVAIVVAILGVTLPMNHLNSVMVVTNFFDIMIPILAVGALLKYLLCCSKSKCCEKGSCDTNSKPSNGGCCNN